MASHKEPEEKRMPFTKEGSREKHPSHENGTVAAGAGAEAAATAAAGATGSKAKSSFPFRNPWRSQQQNGEQTSGPPLSGSAPAPSPLLRADTAAAAPNTPSVAESEESGAAHKTADDIVRKSFQIPKKNKEKKDLCQLVPVGPREFKQDILKILNSNCLDSSSSANFTYMKARLVHNERLEREYMEKRKEMRSEGRLEKELADSYAFLLLEASQVPAICEKGLSVGNSKVTILGNPTMGIYLSKYCDVLQPNPLDNGKKAEIIIFKIVKGRVKAVFDNTTKNLTPPTPKHDCHVFRNLNRVISLFTYRAFDLTQFYLYEFGNEGIRQCPRHVCPYAVVSFIYQENKLPKIAKPVTLGLEENYSGKSYYTIWKGQLMNKGRFLCSGSLQSATQPFLPFKLPEKLNIDTAMSVDCLKNKIPGTIFQKTTFTGTREVLKNGLYYSLYELVEQSKTGRNLEPLFHKLEEEKLVLIKPLDDRGFLFLFSPLEMADNESQNSKPKFLQALFLFPESRLNGAEDIKRNTKCIPVVHSDPEAMPQLSMIIPALHFALEKIRKELPNSLKQGTIDAAFENNVTAYLKNSLQKEAFVENGKLPQFILPTYEEKRFSAARQKRLNLPRILRSYFFNPHRYQFDVSKAAEMLNQVPSPDTEIHSPPVCAAGEQESNDPVPEITAQQPANPQIKSIAVNNNFLVPSDNMADYDPDKIQELIELIYSRKRLGPGEASAVNFERLAHNISDKDDLGLKRKLEFISEQSHKQMKIIQGSLAEDGSRLSETVPQTMNGPSFCDTDLRQSDQAPVLTPDTQKLVGLLLEVLKSSTCQNSGTDLELNQEVRMSVCPNTGDLQQNNVDNSGNVDESNASYYEEMKLKQQQSIDGHAPLNESIKKEHSHKETVSGHDKESPEFGDIGSDLPHNDSNHLKIKTNDQPSGEHSLQINMKAECPEELSVGSISSPERCSPCAEFTHDQPYSRRMATSGCTIDDDIDWKLIPITDMKSRIEQLFYLPPEDSCPVDPRVLYRKSNINHYQSPSDSDTGVGSALKEYSEDFHHSATYGINGHLFGLKGDSASAIEKTVKLEYNKFSDKMKQLLKREKVQYGPDNKRLKFPAVQKVSMLSKYSNTQSHQIPVQSYINQLRKRMNLVISDACPDISRTYLHLHPSSSPELAERTQKKVALISEVAQLCTESRIKDFMCLTEEPNQCNKSVCEEPTASENIGEPEKSPENSALLACNTRLQKNSGRASFTFGSLTDSNSAATTGEDKGLIRVQTLSSGKQQEATCSLQESSGIGALPEPQPCLTNLIQKLNPEVFCSLVEIIKDVQKNTVKFYIYEVEKTSMCAEIKGYLTGLGNKESHPKEFLKRKDGSMDKLLIIIQNEDIASHIHKVPFLTSLKKLSRVSFAGVDTLDDVQNHTYNELFVSGGIVVSDETVLNAECITFEKLQIFLDFLKDLSTPESKWIWKIHCKMHKKLKELARTNTAAFKILTLLNKYQKCNLVEVLSYHDCDSRSRNTIELDCLIKLQAQSMQHRHVVFLTEKYMEPISNCLECGVVVACVNDFVKNFDNLIGYHSSNMGEKQQRLGSRDSLQGTFSSNSLELVEVENADAENLGTSEGNNEEEDMSLDSEDNSPQVEICSEKSEALKVTDISQTEAQRTKGKVSPSNESLLQVSEDAAPKLTAADIPAAALQPLKVDSTDSKGATFAYNNRSFCSHSQIESNYRNFNVITHQSFLTSGIEPAYILSLSQNWQDADRYYSPGYDQNLAYNKNWEKS